MKRYIYASTIFALLVGLSFVPRWAHAQTYFGSLPATYNNSFYVQVDTDVVMCQSAGVNCGSVMRFTASTAAAPAWHNCGLEVPKPAGADATYSCYAAGTMSPPVTPPVTTPPVTTPPVTSPTVTFIACGPTAADIFGGRYRLIAVGSSVSTNYPRLGVWIDSCDGKVKAQYGTLAEVAEVIAQHFASTDSIKAWVAAQPGRLYTATESAFLESAAASFSPHAVVQPTSATVVGDRPVYALNADGTRKTTAVSGKRAAGNAPCDISKRIGTTGYYLVPSLGFYATCIVVSGL